MISKFQKRVLGLLIAVIVVLSVTFIYIYNTFYHSMGTDLGSVVVPRFRLSLDGAWRFRTDPKDIGVSEKWYLKENLTGYINVTIPSCWQSYSKDLLNYHGIAWYQRDFFLSSELKGARITVNFGAVNWKADVWINGKLVGSHEGGYEPFSFDITEYVAFDRENTITVRVYLPPPELMSDIPHGKQTWYSYVGGIWQSVWIEATSKSYIGDVFIIPNVKNSTARIQIEVNNLLSNTQFSIKATITSPTNEVFEGRVTIPRGVTEWKGEIQVPVSNLLLWSPETPYLYNATISLMRGDSEKIDEVSVTFGFRSIEAKDGKILLNGKPIYIRGALNQDFYPNTIYTPPSDDFIKEELLLAKRMGLNLLRIHIKLADPRYLYWADRLGIMIWEEIPNVDSFTINAEERLQKTLEAMIKRDRNHPSVIIWGIANEAWGVNPADFRGREWLVKMYKFVKSLDPTRLVIDNSPTVPNFHVISDINDFHWYNTIPGSYGAWIDFIKRFTSNPDWTFGAPRRGWEPLMVSEFGVWGLPSLKALYEFYNGEPWWFNRGWGSAVPEGVEKRFKEWHLDEIWGDYENMAKATQLHQFEALKFMIEYMRKYPSIVGYIITQFYDLHWESNGLLDFLRNPKAYFNMLPLINNDSLLIIDWEGSKLNLWSGEEFRAKIIVSHFREDRLENLTLRWLLDGEEIGRISNITVEPFSVTNLTEVRFTAPELREAKEVTFEAVLERADGAVVLRNWLRLLVAPRELMYPGIGKEDKILIYGKGLTPELIASLKTRLVYLLQEGYNIIVSDKIDPGARLIITITYDDNIANYLHNGGRAILIANRQMTLNIDGREFIIKPRGGEWVSDFQYIRDKRLVDPLPIENPLGWRFYLCYPRYIIVGVGPEDYKRILSGYFEGWVRENAATTLLLDIGSGTLIITTFNMEHYGIDPTATVILNNLINMLLSR